LLADGQVLVVSKVDPPAVLDSVDDGLLNTVISTGGVVIRLPQLLSELSAHWPRVRARMMVTRDRETVRVLDDAIERLDRNVTD
jgi:hypothetical protein